MGDPEPQLRLIDICKAYKTGEGQEEFILRDINVEVGSGDSIAIIGPSGSGKTTLLNIVGVLDVPTSGSILFQGQDLSGYGAPEQARFRNREVGFVFQSHHLLPQLSLLENVLVPTLADPEIRNSRDSESRARQLLSRVGLEHRMDYRPGRISGGERQRTAVVRALINRPSMLLADEPTGSLDAENAASLTDLLLELNREEGVTLIVVTHSLELASKLDRVFELRKGSLQPAGERS